MNTIDTIETAIPFLGFHKRVWLGSESNKSKGVMKMNKAQKFLEENIQSMPESRAAIIERLTDEEFDVILSATGSLLGDYEDVIREPGIECDLVRTSDTIGDFDKSRENSWREPGSREVLNIGRPAVLYEEVQIFKGQQRIDLVVVDMGDYRIVLR